MMKKTGLALTISIILGLTGCSGGSGGGSSHANLPKDNTVVINPKPQSNTSTTTSTARLAGNSVDTPAESTIDTASNTEKATAEENITHVHLTPDSRSRRIIHGDSKGNEGYSYEDISKQDTPANENSESAVETVAGVDSTPHFFPDRRPPRIRSRRSVDVTSPTGDSVETVAAAVTSPTTTTSTPEKKEEKKFANGKTAEQLPKVPGANPVSSTTDAYGKTRTVYDNGVVRYSYGDEGQEYWKPVIPTKPVTKVEPKLDGLSFIDKNQAEKLLTDLNKSVDNAKKMATSGTDEYILGYGVNFTSSNYSTSVDKHPVNITTTGGKIIVTTSPLNGSIEAEDLAKNQNMYDFVNNPTDKKFLVNVGGDSYLGSNGKELLAFGVKSATMPVQNLHYTGKSIIWTKENSDSGNYHVGGFTGDFDPSSSKFTGTIYTANHNGTRLLQLGLNATSIASSDFKGTVTIQEAANPTWKNKQLKFDGQFNGTDGKGTSGIIYTDESSSDIKGKIGGVYAGSSSATPSEAAK